MKRGIGRRCVIPAVSTTLALIALLTAVSVASACDVVITSDCAKIYVSYTKFPKVDTHVFTQSADYDINGQPTFVGAPKIEYIVNTWQGSFELPYPAGNGTVRRDITISFTAFGKPFSKTATVPVKKCQTAPPPVEVTPPVETTPPTAAPPVETVTPVVPATPVATPAAPPTPKVYKPILNLSKAFTARTAFAGNNLGSHLHFCNAGRGDAYDVVLVDSPSKKATIVRTDGGKMHNGHVLWFIGTLKAGACGDFYPLMHLDVDASGATCNWASIQASNANSAADHVCTKTNTKKRPKKGNHVTG